ncbi:MAG: hypothetical protein WDZ51_14635 [Pirellulaceae bacterium]
MRYLKFTLALILCWWPFMVVHELGHIVSGALSGATIDAVELRPWRLSHTMLSGSRWPLADVWAGPIVGCLLPLLLLAFPLGKAQVAAAFFAGFCLIANGAYIGLGWIGPYGDTAELFRHGAAIWQMILFGIVCFAGGILIWYRLDRQAEDFPNRPPT